jgi:CheY-like chemotaxis protein
MQNSKPILLIEDDDVDVMTVKRSLRDLKVANQLVPIGDGEEAIEYLRNECATKPCLILLDLNMPKMDGAEFLKIVKADKALKKIPVVILTTSNSDRDVIESFELGAAGYMVKSVDYEKFVETIRAIDLYWTVSKLPSNGE